MLDRMKNVQSHKTNGGIYCPWNNRIGICHMCMALIQTDENEFICGRLYPPEHFKEETE